MPLSEDQRRLGAWYFPLVVFLSSNLLYMMVSWFPNHKYLEWAESRPQCQDHLPDLLLDMHDYGVTATSVTNVADAIPGIFLIVTAAITFTSGNLLIWNRFLMTQAFIMFLNMCAEQSTVIPSSYGLTRCKAYLGVKTAAEDKYAFSPTGSCVAMMWSGHVFNMMVGGYHLGLVLEQRFPSLKRRSLWGTASAPLLKSLIVVALAVCEMMILVVDKGHYTVDMFVAMVISMLTFTNDNVEYWIFRINPWIRLFVPVAEQPMKHGQLREIVRELQIQFGGLQPRGGEPSAMELAAQPLAAAGAEQTPAVTALPSAVAALPSAVAVVSAPSDSSG